MHLIITKTRKIFLVFVIRACQELSCFCLFRLFPTQNECGVVLRVEITADNSPDESLLKQLCKGWSQRPCTFTPFTSSPQGLEDSSWIIFVGSYILYRYVLVTRYPGNSKCSKSSWRRHDLPRCPPCQHWFRWNVGECLVMDWNPEGSYTWSFRELYGAGLDTGRLGLTMKLWR